MKPRVIILFCLLSIVTLLPLWQATRASAESVVQGKAPAETGISIERFTTDIKKSGLEVAEGYFQLYSIEDCPQTFELMETCFLNNPAAPYVFAVVPYWPDEFVDPATQGVFGPTEDGYGTTYRLDPNEAILVFGVLPPQGKYFGIQSYLFSRKGNYKTNNDTYSFINAIGATDVFFHRIPGNLKRIVSFDSLSDSNNNVVIERQSGGSFGELRYFIITPDPYMDKVVREVLHNLSVAEEDIFTEHIPSNVKTGLDKHADDFATGIRYSMPDDGGKEGTPSDEWRHNPPLTLLRIRDTRPHWPPHRYPTWGDDSPETRTAVDEHWLKPDLEDLLMQISEQWGQPCAMEDCSDRAMPFIDTQSEPFNLVGPLCDNIGMDCQADTQDASYQFRGNITFDDDEVYAVVGTLGTATGNATYVSLGVNNFHLRLGALNIDTTQLEGSTKSEWYPGVNNLDQFYVYYFTRNCESVKDLTHEFCQSVADDELVIPTGVKAAFVERDYLRKDTQRGPDSKLTLPSRVIKFRKPAQ